jgi:hypothetical protein
MRAARLCRSRPRLHRFRPPISPARAPVAGAPTAGACAARSFGRRNLVSSRSLSLVWSTKGRPLRPRRRQPPRPPRRRPPRLRPRRSSSARRAIALTRLPACTRAKVGTGVAPASPPASARRTGRDELRTVGHVSKHGRKPLRRRSSRAAMPVRRSSRWMCSRGPWETARSGGGRQPVPSSCGGRGGTGGRVTSCTLPLLCAFQGQNTFCPCAFGRSNEK